MQATMKRTDPVRILVGVAAVFVTIVCIVILVGAAKIFWFDPWQSGVKNQEERNMVAAQLQEIPKSIAVSQPVAVPKTGDPNAIVRQIETKGSVDPRMVGVYRDSSPGFAKLSANGSIEFNTPNVIMRGTWTAIGNQIVARFPSGISTMRWDNNRLYDQSGLLIGSRSD